MAFTFLMISFRAGAQQISQEEVDIVKPYQPLLADAAKIQTMARPLPVDTAHRPLTYSIRDKTLQLPFTPADAKPIAMPAPPPEPLLNNMVKAGFGTQTTPLLQASFANGRSDKYQISANIEHTSSKGKTDFQKFSKSGGGLLATVYSNHIAVSANVNLFNRVHYYYGYNHADTSMQFTDDSLRQRFTNFTGTLHFFNSKSNEWQFNYSIQPHFHSFNSLSGIKENQAGYTLKLDKRYEEKHIFSFESTLNSLRLTDSVAFASTLLQFQPSYTFTNGPVLVFGGFSAESWAGEWKLFPQFRLEYELMPEVTLFFGVEGHYELNSFSKLTGINPFLMNLDSVTSTKSVEPFAGLKGSLAENISYHFSLGYAGRQNDVFFLPDSAAVTRFLPVYYNNVKRFRFHAAVDYRLQERLNAKLEADYFSYDLDFEDKPWGILQSQIGISLRYSIEHKIIAEASLFAYPGVFHIDPVSGATVQAGGTVAPNFSITYNYNKNVSAFLQFDNLLAQKYERWYRYPSYGFRFLGGLMLKF